ncbi:hypothetical protein JW960_05450 [candidate division KSB1 bacterium]|nr:hypothetical protein [candidate division KSB1 bacterium]
MRNKKWLALILVASMLPGCAGNSKLTRKRNLVIPVGVDSTTAELADSTAQDIFVEFEQEDKANKLKQDALLSMVAADTIWNFLKFIGDTSAKVTREQRQQAIARFNRGAANMQRVMDVQKRLNRKGINEKTIKELRSELYKILIQAKQSFEEAIKLNPFDLENRDALSWVLWKLVQYYENKDANIELINVLTELTILDKGDDQLYFRLGQAYHSMEYWDRALKNFQKAEQMLRDFPSSDMTDQALKKTEQTSLSPEDSLNLYTYIYYQGDTYAELLDAKQALERLETALTYTHNPERQQVIHQYVEWINWDNGNVRASKLKDKILETYAQDNNHKKAVTNFKKLLTILQNRRAKDEINWRIARIEFTGLNELEEGIDRLSKIVFTTKKNAQGFPVDSTYNPYFEDFAIMCNNIAMHNLTNRLSRKFAYTYLLQAVQIHSTIRGNLYVELAKLTNNNPTTCINNSLEAFKYINPEDAENLGLIMKSLTNSYRRLGQQNEVKLWYALWKLLKANQWKDLHYGISNAFARTPDVCVRWSQYTLDNYRKELSKREVEQLQVLLLNSYKTMRDRGVVSLQMKKSGKFGGAN